MQSKTALIVFGSFLALNLVGFAGAVVVKQFAGAASDEEKYGGLSKEAFAARVVEEGVGALEDAPVDAMAMEMVTKTETGQTFATMRVAVSEPRKAMDMHWVMDFDLLREYAPPEAGEEDVAAGLEELFAEFRVTQVDDRLVISFGGETYEQRGVAGTDFDSISNFVASPVPGASEQTEGSADPTGFFSALTEATDGLTIHKISEGRFQERSAWRVEASYEDEESKGTMVFIAAKKTGLPLLVTMKVTDPRHPDIPPADITFTFTYGDAVTVELPPVDGATRLPATFNYELSVDTPTRIEGAFGEGTSPVPLSELDLRVVEYKPPSGESFSFAPEVTKALASLRLDAASATQAGYELTFTDNGDGVLSAGDRFVAKAPGDKPFKDPQQVNGTWQSGVGVRFFDHWANAYEGTPGPGLGFGVAALAAGALALAARRRKDEP